MKFQHFIYISDTPGFENENKTKPEETKIISAGAGLAQPTDMAEKILTDSLVIEKTHCMKWILEKEKQNYRNVIIFHFRVEVLYQYTDLKA